MRQLFATGQTVNVAPGSLTGPSSEGIFRVVRRYLIEKTGPMYHVSSLRDGGQRMVPESELSVAMPQIFAHTDGPGKIVRLFPNVVAFNRPLHA